MYYVSTVIEGPRDEGLMTIIKASDTAQANRILISAAARMNWFIVPLSIEAISEIDPDDETIEDIRADPELWRQLQTNNIVVYQT